MGGPVTRKPSMRAALDPVFAKRGQPTRRSLLLGRGEVDDDLVARVVAFLAENPATSASAVAARVRGRRQDVLRVVRTLRGGSHPVPKRSLEPQAAALGDTRNLPPFEVEVQS